MIICGIKLTHDASIALIENGKLIFCFEAEKINNAPRYSEWNNFNFKYLSEILSDFGYKLTDIDKFVFDGWGDFNTLEYNDYALVKRTVFLENGEEMTINLQRYGMYMQNEDLFESIDTNFQISQRTVINSYMHVSGHIMSAYCTSPFAIRNDDSFILVWDGGMCPQLFYLHAKDKRIENLGPLFFLLGGCYGAFASNYEPFNHLEFDDLSISGKLMDYIELGEKELVLIDVFKNIYRSFEEKFELSNLKPQMTQKLTSEFLKEIVIYGELEEIDPKNMMSNFHFFIEDLLIEKLIRITKTNSDFKKNFCYVGGCALNIKWNSKLRNSILFEEFWIPPFPNDSGSAIGAACCELFLNSEEVSLDWTVYSGPLIKNDSIIDSNWLSFDLSVSKLAEVLYFVDEPIVVLEGHSELGPRSLGNRSIIASPINDKMKETLNNIKNRENYRPIAPICIEEFATSFFEPGTPDPFMLYDHSVKSQWRKYLSAICHLDFSARLQTVSQLQNPFIYSLLLEFKELSGIPILCNTSANFNGKGFFPNIESVIKWNKVNLIWSNNSCFVKRDSVIHHFLTKSPN